MDQWYVDPSYPRSWNPKKWTWAIQLIQPFSNKLELPFTQAASTIDYVIMVFHMSLRWNSIDIRFWGIKAKLIETGNKCKTSDPSDPSD